ncbi:hypothetical protein CLV99_3943 [Sphingobacterium yanglingense]|uniref:Uncharacterized protein n=1 Tax=Sphingobacterium yanglingense TaxID=1437280 RepID=A0A4R6WE64_9SPHI|nr:hypothetical protein CLV99_3943 [Sphingobacterium yanglingense]
MVAKATRDVFSINLPFLIIFVLNIHGNHDKTICKYQ